MILLDVVKVFFFERAFGHKYTMRHSAGVIMDYEEGVVAASPSTRRSVRLLSEKHEMTVLGVSFPHMYGVLHP